MYKVLFHLDEVQKTLLSLQNISNLILEIGYENIEIELVINGEAVTSFQKSDQSLLLNMQSLIKRGVLFCVCAHSMQHLVIQKNDLFDFVVIVPSGVAEIVKKQAEGWIYIRP
jgi:intracellular sulfur oxidation DsrE/DsrF family protein